MNPVHQIVDECVKHLPAAPLHRTFPHNSHPPVSRQQPVMREHVAAHVVRDFGKPECGSGFRCCGQVAVVSVPEAAIDENHRFVFWQNNVRAAGQRFHVQTESEASGAGNEADGN